MFAHVSICRVSPGRILVSDMCCSSFRIWPRNMSKRIRLSGSILVSSCDSAALRSRMDSSGGAEASKVEMTVAPSVTLILIASGGAGSSAISEIVLSSRSMTTSWSSSLSTAS